MERKEKKNSREQLFEGADCGLDVGHNTDCKSTVSCSGCGGGGGGSVAAPFCFLSSGPNVVSCSAHLLSKASKCSPCHGGSDT